MSDIGRWGNVDPLAEQTPNWSPYAFCNNNPLFFTDPTGMSASPLYDENGNFLGTDSEGFKGEVRFMKADVYNSIVNDKNSSFATNGVIDHDKVKYVSQSLDLVIGANPNSTFTEGEINMVNNAISDVVSKTDGMQFGMSDLHNGKTSSYFAVPDVSTSNGFDYNIQSANDAHPYTFTNPDVPASMGDNTMTFNLTSRLWSGGELTVNNIQNAAIHEGNGHFVKDIPGEGKGHAKAFQMQFNHSSWQGTTPAWKKEMRNSFNLINQGKL